MDYKNSNKLIFVVASAGGGGHRLGRIVCCFNNVFWYEAIRNGKYPWRIFSSDEVKGKNISPYHFDRRTSTNMIPLLGERIERFWYKNDLDYLYSVNWKSEMDKAGADLIIKDDKYLVWVVHDLPEYLLEKFPNAKIINLVDTDVNKVIDRYLKTTAFFPVSIENKNLKPDYNNEYATLLLELEKINPYPTYRDFWAWENKGSTVFQDSMLEEYKTYISKIFNYQHEKRIKNCPEYLSVSWDNLDIDAIKNYIGASTINENYSSLIKS